MITSLPESSHPRLSRGHPVDKFRDVVNRTGRLSADRVVGWLARAYRLTQSDCTDTSIDALLARTSMPVSKSMVSMLENGRRRWTPEMMALMERAFSLEDSPLQRIYLTLEGGSGLSGLNSQTAADNLDEIIGGNIERIPSLDVVRTLQWATTRSDPLGRRSWAEVVVNYIDRTCDTKGIYSKECDQALSNLAAHSVAKEYYLEYMQELSNQFGHPKSFVPITALQAQGAHVDIAYLVRQIRQPDNRWLIREHLNLAGAKMFDSSVSWSDSQVAHLDRAAHAWRIDSNSEAEVVRAATDLRHCIHLRNSGKTRASLQCLTPGPTHERLKEFATAQKIIANSSMVSVDDSGVLDILATLIGAAIYDGADRYRSVATRVLSVSPFASAVRNHARMVLDGVQCSPVERPNLRSWIRILGKLGSDVKDAEQLWHFFVTCTDRSLLETTAWALCDISAIVFPASSDKALQVMPSKYQNVANGSVSRALISAYGRAGKWSVLSGVPGLAGDPLMEIRWWLKHRAPGQ